MINAMYLGHDEENFLRTIVEEKNEPKKSILRGILPRILVGYEHYLNDFENLSTRPQSQFDIGEVLEREALNHCYGSTTRTFNRIKGDIFNAQPNELKSICPYCLLDRPTTFDHYVGKTEFPEYSILVKNLVPCCSACNNKKNENWRRRGFRRFIHFYNDNFLSKPFLFGRLYFPAGSITPSIQFSLRQVSLTSVEFKIVKTHFKDLDLLKNYQDRANSTVSSEIEILRQSMTKGLLERGSVSGLLSERADSLARRLGINFWEAVMYNAMSNSKKLIASL